MQRFGLTLSAFLFAVSMSSCFQNSADVERELRAAMDQRRAALERGDADGYAKLTADDLVIIDDDGLYRTKASVLQQIKRDGPRPPARNISDLHLQVNGDIGIISYHVDKEDRIGNQSIKSETRDLDIYERRSGKWILISRAIVPLPYPNRAPAIVDSSVYGSYVGVYDFGDNFLVTVKTEGDKLLIFNSEDKTPQRLLPFSNISFYLDKSSGVLTFVRDTKGKVLALEIWDSNSTIRGQKIN